MSHLLRPVPLSLSPACWRWSPCGEFRLSYPQLRDGEGSNLKRFEMVSYPETVVLGRHGRIAATSRGPVDDRFFTERVLPLLKEPT